MMLMPVDVREWLSEDDLVWHVLDVVAALDLSAFYGRLRQDGRGGASFDPATMVALVIYAQAVGVRSSRAIERACTRDAGFKVVTAQQVPDHSTITRFVAAHQEALTGLFTQVLRLCRAAGMAQVGVIAVDGTKVQSAASWSKSYTEAALDHQLAEAESALAATQEAMDAVAAGASGDVAAGQLGAGGCGGDGLAAVAGGLLEAHLATDAAEDAVHGAARGDELPKQLRSRKQRVEKIKAAKADLDARAAQARAVMLAEQAAKQAAWDERAAEQAAAKAADAAAKAEADAAAAAANAEPGSEATDDHPKDDDVPPSGAVKMKGLGPRPHDEVKVGSARSRQSPPRASVTDPESRRMKAKVGYVQGYNAQASCTLDQVIVGVLVSQAGTDHHQMSGILAATQAALDASAAGGADPARLDVVLADAGYANEATFRAVEALELTLLAPLGSDEKRAQAELTGTALDPSDGRDLSQLPATERAQARLDTDAGRELYKQRGRTIEPVFGQVKDGRGLRRFRRCGLDAVQAEFSLGATVHNVMKLFRKLAGARLASLAPAA